MRKTYPVAGTATCIYCGIPAELCELHEEHIIAFSMGGTMVLPEASCSDCGDITGAIEGHCCEYMFKSLRMERNLPTRRRKKRATHLPIIEEFAEDIRASETQLVPVKDYPSHLALPVFEPPGILLGSNPIAEFRNVRLVMLYVSRETESRVKRLRERGLRGVKAFHMFRPVTFAQMLAKIGHAFATAEYGANVFEPLLIKFMRGNDPFGS
jgi:hypothetical protein